MNQIDRIRAKLEQQDLYIVAPCSTVEVAAFENRMGVELPEDYKTFITTVANGGAGPPDCSMLPLGTVPKYFTGSLRSNWEELPNLKKPFPFTKRWCWENGELSDEGDEDDVDCGSLMLGEDGCGMQWHLIVTGPDRGMPWMLSGEGILPVCPKRGFLDWYEDWLDGRDSFYGYDLDK